MAQWQSETFKTHLKKSVTPLESKNQKQEDIVDRTDIRCMKQYTRTIYVCWFSVDIQHLEISKLQLISVVD